MVKKHNLSFKTRGDTMHKTHISFYNPEHHPPVKVKANTSRQEPAAVLLCLLYVHIYHN